MPKPADVDPSKLHKVAASSVRLLWVNDWYDGPLEAVVERDGERLLMLLHGELAADVAANRWLLYPLTDAQWAEEERWHRLFEEHVGHHWCMHHDAPPARGGGADDGDEPSRDPKRFYEPYATRAPLDLSSNEPVGWLDEMPTGAAPTQSPIDRSTA